MARTLSRVAVVFTAVLGTTAVVGLRSPARAEDPPAKAGADRPFDFWEWRTQTLADLASGDKGRVEAAVRDVRDKANFRPMRGMYLGVLRDGKRYDEAERTALDVLRSDPTSESVGAVQKFRAEVLIAQGRWADALSLARSYYDSATLKDTAEAVQFVTTCLLNARPNDPGVALRFRRQQAAWATVATTRPAAAGEGANGAADDLGAPVLATIPVDAKPFAERIAALQPTDYEKISYKGNLLLVSGRAADARVAFQQAQALANGTELAQAIEDEARAVRAESGCIGPANAFIERQQTPQRP